MKAKRATEVIATMTVVVVAGAAATLLQMRFTKTWWQPPCMQARVQAKLQENRRIQMCAAPP